MESLRTTSLTEDEEYEWTADMTHFLINQWENVPFLNNPNHPDYNILDRRSRRESKAKALNYILENIIENISLGVPPQVPTIQQILKKLDQLKSKYNDLKHKYEIFKKTSVGTKGYFQINWDYFEYLYFLDPDSAEYPDSDSDSDSDSDEHSYPRIWCPDDNILSTFNSQTHKTHVMYDT